MGDTLSHSTERMLAGIKNDIAELQRNGRGPSTPPVYRRSPIAVTEDVTQEAHGFESGQIIAYNGDTDLWELATGDTITTFGLVYRVRSADTFSVCLSGAITPEN